jgi:tryptophanyl-tRNA synthetase
MRIVTDSTPLADSKDPGKCNVFALYRLFATDEQAARMAQQYRDGGYGYGQAKQALFEIIWSSLEPFREKRRELCRNQDYVEDILRQGAAKAREEAAKTLKAARRAMGLD